MIIIIIIIIINVPIKLKRNDTSTKISQLILGGKLLIFVIDGQKNNFSDRQTCSNNLLPKICCKNVVDITLL